MKPLTKRKPIVKSVVKNVKMEPLKPYVGGKKVTYGFECEFRASVNAYNNVISSKNGVLVSNFSWIDKKISKERSGNTEVRSTVSTDLLEQLNRMQLLKTLLHHEMRGFHIHFRIGMDIFTNEKITNNILGWLGRFGDMILLWRLEHFNPKWALSQWSQIRTNIEWLRGNNKKWRGVIRTFKIDDRFDIEIRGLMSNINMFYKCVSLIVNRLQDPEKLEGYYQWQKSSMQLEDQEKLKNFVERYTKNKLSEKEIKTLDWLELYSTTDEWKHPKRGAKTLHGRGNIVLYGFEEAPFFDQNVQSKIKLENVKFCNRLLKLINTVSDKNLLTVNYHEEMKIWVKNIGLYQILLNTL